MPQNRIKVQFPFGGISDALAKSTQPQLTTRDAQNCRGKDSKTGRIRGAQRAGLSGFPQGQVQPTDADGVTYQTPVQALTGVSYDQPRIDFTRLVDWRNETIRDGEPNCIRDGLEWAKGVQGDGSAYSPVVDVQGNVYVITEGRTIHKYNPEGTLVTSLTIPSTSTSSVVRSLAVDALGNIYAIVAVVGTGAGGQLIRWEPHEDLEYTIRYDVALQGSPSYFKLRFNTLWVITELPYGGPSQSRLEAWGFLETDAPMRLWSRYIPHPAYGVELSDSGHIFIGSGANTDRVPDAQGINPGVIGWTPAEMYRAPGRIHTWLDAYYVPGTGTGTELRTWDDNRLFLPSEVNNFVPVYDTQPRSAINPFQTPSTEVGHLPPYFMANGFGDKPSIKFDRKAPHSFGGSLGEQEVGQGLYFKANESTENRDKIRVDYRGPYSDSWEDQTALVPGPKTVLWTMFLVVRLGDQAAPGCLLNMYGVEVAGQRMDFQILTNLSSELPGSGPLNLGLAPGKVMLRGGLGEALGASYCYAHITPVGGDHPVLGSNCSSAVSVDGDTRTAIIAVHYVGNEVDGSVFRVNGATESTFRLTQGGYADVAAAQSATPGDYIRGAYLGVPFKSYAIQGGAPGESEHDLAAAVDGDLKPFDGDIMEILVVNGHTLATGGGGGDFDDPTYIGHGLAYTANYDEDSGGQEAINVTWGAPISEIETNDDDYGNAAGTVGAVGGRFREHYRAEPTDGTEFQYATEVELIEGYLAHKWGIANTLADTHPFKETVPGDFADYNPTQPVHSYSPLAAFDDWGAFISTQDQALISVDPIVAKYDPSNGDVVWAATGAGMGNGVVVDNKGGVYTCGAPLLDEDGEEIDKTRLRKIIDLGSDFSLTDYGGQQAWTKEGWDAGTSAYKYVDLKLDEKAETLFVPMVRSNTLRGNGAPSGEEYPWGRLTAVKAEDGNYIFRCPFQENVFIPNPDATTDEDGNFTLGLGPDTWTWGRDISQWRTVEYDGTTDANKDDAKLVTHSYSRIRLNASPELNPDGEIADTVALTEVGVPDKGPNWTLGTHTTVAPGRARFKNLLFPFDRKVLGGFMDTFSTATGSRFGPSPEMLDAALLFESYGTDYGGWNNVGSAGRVVQRKTTQTRSPAWDYEACRVGHQEGTTPSAFQLLVYNDRIDTFENTSDPDGKKFILSAFIKLDGTNGEGSNTTARLKIQQYSNDGGTARSHSHVVEYNLDPAYTQTRATRVYSAPDGATDFGIRQVGPADENGHYWYQCWVSLTFLAAKGLASDMLKVDVDPVRGASEVASHAFVWMPQCEIVTDTSAGPTQVTVEGFGGNGPVYVDGFSQYPVGNQSIAVDGADGGIYVGKPVTDESSADSDRGECLVHYPDDFWVSDRKRVAWLQFWVKEQDTTDGAGRPDMGKCVVEFDLAANCPDDTVTFGTSASGHRQGSLAENRAITIDARKGVDDSARITELDHSGTSYGGTYHTLGSSSTNWPYGNNHRAKTFDNGWILVGVRLKNHKGTATYDGSQYLAGQIQTRLMPSATVPTSTTGELNGTAYTNHTDNLFASFFNAEVWGFQLFVGPWVLIDGETQFPTETYYDPGRRGVTGIAFPPTEPDYTGDVDDKPGVTEGPNNSEPAGPEFAYVTTLKEQGRYGPNVLKQRLVAAEPLFEDGQSSRATKVVAVAGGDVFTVSGGEPGYEIATEGRGALEADAGQIMSTPHFGKLYFTDGFKYARYNPVTNEIEEFKAETAGEIPKRARLIASYRGRLVFARTSEDPNNYFMSAVGDPEDWDYYPTTPVVTQAIHGGLARAGKSPDVINALIPYNDDLLLLGGDHTIFRMTGDPAAGGQLDQVTSSVGIAFGESWTMDPEGGLYFFTPQGCVYVMAPTGQPQRLSTDAIERRMQGVDLTQYKVKLVWNQEDYGLHVFFMPYTHTDIGVNDAVPYCFFWEKGGNAWWPDRFSHTRTPYAATVINGEKPADRKLLIGNNSGNVMMFDRDRTTDFGKKIHSYATMTISQPQDSEVIMPRVVSVHPTMGGNTLNARLHLIAYDEPLDAPAGEEVNDGTSGVVSSSDVNGGRNGRLPMRGRGPFVEVRVQNDSPTDDAGGYWAIEEVRVDVAASGRRRDV